MFVKRSLKQLTLFRNICEKKDKENHKEFLHNILSYSKEGRIFSYATTPAA